MKSKNLMTRILFSLFAITLLATVSAAQTAPAKSAKPGKASSAMAAPAESNTNDSLPVDIFVALLTFVVYLQTLQIFINILRPQGFREAKPFNRGH